MIGFLRYLYKIENQKGFLQLLLSFDIIFAPQMCYFSEVHNW